MIELKEARQKASQLLEKVPSNSNLRNWTQRGVVSKREDYVLGGRPGGRRGLYPDRIVPEILTAQSMKEKDGLSISQIVEARLESGGKGLVDKILEYPDRNWTDRLRELHKKGTDNYVDTLLGKNDMGNQDARIEYMGFTYALRFWKALQDLEKEGLIDLKNLKAEAKEKEKV